MTVRRQRRFGAAILVVCFGMTGCGPGGELAWPTPQMELHVSEPQRLIVTNDKQTAVTVETADGKPSIALSPGAKLELDFQVTTVAELEFSPRGPWYLAREEGRIDLMLETTSPGVLRTRGPDVEILFRLPAGDAATASLSMQCAPRDRWGDRPAKAATHNLTVTTLIDGPSGIPLRLCPVQPTCPCTP